MSESEFLRTVEATLARLEAAIDAARIGAECSQSGLILTIELDDGAKVIVNAQAPMRQLWLASRAGARHFSFDGERWRDTRGGAEFFAVLSQVLSELCGTPVQLPPP